MAGAMVDWGRQTDWPTAGGAVAGEAAAVYGEEGTDVADPGRTDVPAPMKPSPSRRTQGPLSPGGDAVGAA